MATHSIVLAWRIPGTGEPGGLPSMGSHRVGHDWSDLAAAAAVALSSVVLLRQSSPWMLLKAPLQGEVGLGHRKVGGKSCLDGPTSLFRKRGSLPPIILGFGASTEARKCPVYNCYTFTISLSLFFLVLFDPLHSFLLPPPSPLAIYSLYLWACFIVFVFSESIYKCKSIQYWFFSLWCIFLSIMHSRSIGPVPNGKISIFLMTE